MSNSNKNILAQVKLTPDDLNRIVVNEIMKNESAKKVLSGKKVAISADWHIFKWDNPNHLVTFTLVESEE